MSRMDPSRIAVITGSNKGIGLAIVQGLLASNYPGVVYLTSRNPAYGEHAVSSLQQAGLNAVTYHQLDITDAASIDRFSAHIRNTHGGIDLLINNAAIKYNSKSTVPTKVQFEGTLKANYYGTKALCEQLFPLLKDNAQVINVSSAAGHICAIPDPDLRSKFISAKPITIEKVDVILEEVLARSKDVTWKNAAYVISKVAVCALTIAQQARFDRELPQRNIRVNSVHPGYVATDMTNYKGTQTPAEGAKSALFLALGDKHNYKGEFIWYNCERVDWDSQTMPQDISR